MEGKKLLNQIDLCVTFIKQTGKNDILLLVDVMNVEVSTASQLKFAEAAKQVKEFTKKTVVVGLTPVKRTIANAINKITGLGARGMETDIEAKDWLISNK
jgi:uncharacterized protein with PhoU and TrkA domain